MGSCAGPPNYGSECWSLDRCSLSQPQLAALEALVLIPLRDGCPADVFVYDELTVVDADGSRVTYRDTVCVYLRVKGATAMLPSSSFRALSFLRAPRHRVLSRSGGLHYLHCPV